MRGRTWGYLAGDQLCERRRCSHPAQSRTDDQPPTRTIEVANLNPVQGEDVPITNADNDDSRCVGGIPVVFVDAPSSLRGSVSQLVGNP